jgi:hypothetical protein
MIVAHGVLGRTVRRSVGKRDLGRKGSGNGGMKHPDGCGNVFSSSLPCWVALVRGGWPLGWWS